MNSLVLSHVCEGLTLMVRTLLCTLRSASLGGEPTDPHLSPLLAPSHAGLPRTFIQVMALDPLHDDGVAYERVLREAGVETRIVE